MNLNLLKPMNANEAFSLNSDLKLVFNYLSILFSIFFIFLIFINMSENDVFFSKFLLILTIGSYLYTSITFNRKKIKLGY